MDLVCLKVRIGLRKNGEADHPDFNQLPSVKASGMDWSHYIDKQGSGWIYDKCCGHADDKPGSPRGMQWGLLLVPETFADEAAAALPLVCEKLAVADAEAFYNTHHGEQLEEYQINENVLAAIRAKREAGLPLSPRDSAALDPETPEPGVRRNKARTFAGFCEHRGFKIKPEAPRGPPA